MLLIELFSSPLAPWQRLGSLPRASSCVLSKTIFALENQNHFCW